MSKMREALREQEERMHKGEASPGFPYRDSTTRTALSLAAREIHRIAQRYGDLEFTPEEVRGMLEEAAAYVHYIHGAGEAFPPPPQYELEATANHILSRHLGESESGDKKPDWLCCGLIDLTKRIEAIEKRVLADGHSEGCVKGQPRPTHIKVPATWPCYCGHDEIRENSK